MKGRSIIMIPGPIEFDQAVLAAMGQPTTSHVAPDFIETFGQSLEQMRDLFYSPSGQPFIIAGTGTLAMDMAVCNLVESGDKALVISTGYFGDRFTSIFTRYGASVKSIGCEVGNCPSLEMIESELKQAAYKVMTITHVDTSTGVLNRVKEISALGKKYNCLVIVDGVCSIAGETLKMDEWGIDITFTASQKAVGVPPGLALMVASEKALSIHKNRKTPVANYYGDWANWLPVMNAYEDRKAAYFGTPAVNLICALNVSLKQILAEGVEARWKRHSLLSVAFKKAMSALGLTQLPSSEDIAAHTMTAVYYPEGINASLLGKIKEDGVILATGLHPSVKEKYFRIGHMGSVDIGDLLKTIAAIEAGLAKSGYQFESGAGVAAAMKCIIK